MASNFLTGSTMKPGSWSESSGTMSLGLENLGTGRAGRENSGIAGLRIVTVGTENRGNSIRGAAGGDTEVIREAALALKVARMSTRTGPASRSRTHCKSDMHAKR
jgi:hypothetical protein